MKFCGLASLATTAVAGTPNIVELAQSVDSLSTLVTAVVAGGLADTLSTGGPFTVFAPSNDAFGTLGDSLDNLLKAENKDVLVELLLNHVVDGTLKAADLDIGSKNLKTLSGGRLSTSYYGFEGDFARVCVVAGGLSCHYLTKAGSDNVASNGIVHIVDGVLVPDYGKLELTNKLASSNIVGLAQSVDDLSTLVAAVVAGDLVDTLSSAGPLTVLAPTNEGFAALPAGTVENLLKPENKATLVDILTYHVLPTQVPSYFLYPTKNDEFSLTSTVQGLPLRFTSVRGGKISVGSSIEELRTVTAADNWATNGVVHIIDGVMLPSSFESDKRIRLTTTKGGGTSFDVMDGKCYQLSSVDTSTQNNDQRIVCEPSGDAYVLQYLSNDGSCTQELVGLGGRTKARKGSTIGNQASNRAIKFDCSPPADPNIVELAETVSDLSTLVAAVVAGDLVATLTSPGPFTVFAPTNAGFAALPAGTLDSLMKPANKGQLVDILTYHVLSGKVLSTDLDLFQEVTTVEGKKLKIQVFGGKVQVGASLSSADLKQVTAADNLASNGVVHIINGVLLPPSSDVVV